MTWLWSHLGHIVLPDSSEGSFNSYCTIVSLVPKSNSPQLIRLALFIVPDLESLQIISLLVKCPLKAQPGRVKLETWMSETPVPQRPWGRPAALQSLWLGRHHDGWGQWVLCVGRPYFLPTCQGLSCSVTKRNIGNHPDLSPSNMALYELAVFRSRLVVKEVSARVLSSLGLGCASLSVSPWESRQRWQRNSSREKKNTLLCL